MAGFPLPTTKGRLLIAAPPLGDPNFDRTVVYVLEHNEHGALGVVVNRVSAPIEAAFENWTPYLAPPASAFAGGPVQVEAFIALGRLEDGIPVTHPAGLLGGETAKQDATITGDSQFGPAELT